MKKTRPVLFLIIILLLMTMLPTNVFAASVSVSASSKTVDAGDTVTVKVTFKGSKLYGAAGSFSYDSSVLQYVSGANTSNGKIAVYASDPANGASSLSVSIKFKAKKSGSTSVSVSGTDIINTDGESLGSAKGSTKITVKSSAPDPTKKPAETKKPTETKKPSQTKKPTETKKPVQTKKPADTPKATKTPKPTPTLTPVPTMTPSNITAKVEDENMLVVSDISGIGIPEGAERDEIDYQGTKIDVAIKFDMNLVYLTDSKGQNGKFYRYEDNEFLPYIEINQSESYVVLPLPKDVEVPEGFNAARLTVANSSVQGWANENGQYIIYAIDSKGNKGFYSYDYSESGLQKYVAGTASAPTETPSNSAAPSSEPTVMPSSEPTTSPSSEAAPVNAPAEPPSGFWGRIGSDIGFSALIYGLSLLCLVLLILFITGIIRRGRRANSAADLTDHEPVMISEPVNKKPAKLKKTGKHGR